jgi:hypothetical protein
LDTSGDSESVSAASVGYNPAQNVVVTATNTTGDLLGVNGSGVGQGLPITLPESPDTVMEFDFTGADQVQLTSGDLYAFEIWDPLNGGGGSGSILYVDRDTNPGAMGYASSGQLYGTSTTAGAAENSSTNRGQFIGGSARQMLFAVYAEPSNVSATWNIAGSGDWNVGNNWSLGTVPNGPGATANLGSALTGNHTVYSDTAITLNVLNFNNSHEYVVAGAGSLTMTGTSAAVNVTGTGQTQEINLPLTIAANTAFNVASSSQLIIANPMTVNSGISVTTPGAGSVVYQSIVTLQSGASLAIPNSTFANTLSLASGATVNVTPHGSNLTSLLQLDNLSLSTGTVNLSNNDMVVHNGGSSLATVTAAIAQGRNGGSSLWSGSAGGITSSTAAANPTLMALGVEDNDNGSGSPLVTTFDGQTVADGDTLVKYTVVGDADLTGSITAADYLQIDNGFQNHLIGWHNGDFNYDGVINGDDYSLIDNAYNTQAAGGLSVSAGPAEQFGVPTESIATPEVPEPTSLSLLGVGAVATFARRRRRV